MYRILIGQMIKKEFTIKKLSGLLEIAEKTLRNKINGETEFEWPGVCKIHRFVNPEMLKEELFEKEK